jgi:hypothetical protein
MFFAYGGRARRALGRLFVVTLIGLLAGCVTATHRQAAELQRTQGISRMVLMPLDVELSHLTAGGLLEPDAGWTEQAQHNMHAVLTQEAQSRNVELVDFNLDRGTPEDRETSLALVNLHRAVGNAIMLHQYTPNYALPSMHGKFGWSLGPEAAAIARSQNAEYAMFLFVRDSYTTTGRVILIAVAAAFGLGLQGGTQAGFASVVDLRTGDIVWFNRLLRAGGDLRTPAAARETVKALVVDSMK